MLQEKATHKGTFLINSNSQKKHVLPGTRCSHGLGPLPRVVARLCELILHVSFTSLTEVRVVRDKRNKCSIHLNSQKHGPNSTLIRQLVEKHPPPPT